MLSSPNKYISFTKAPITLDDIDRCDIQEVNFMLLLMSQYLDDCSQKSIGSKKKMKYHIPPFRCNALWLLVYMLYGIHSKYTITC